MRQIVEAGLAAVQRIVGVPAVGDRAEPGLERVIEEKRPTRLSPMPSSSFTTSTAASAADDASDARREYPPPSKARTVPSGGGSGNRQR